MSSVEEVRVAALDDLLDWSTVDGVSTVEGLVAPRVGELVAVPVDHL